MATFEPGLRGPEVEHLLRARGFTLGHFPQSFEYSTVGGWVATRSAGQASVGYGRIDDLVVGATLAAPAGDVTLPALPASAAGPDLRELVVGSEGALGVLTSVSLTVAPRPPAGLYEGWMFPSLEAGAAALRELVQGGIAPDVCRLSDEHETEMSLALAGLSGARAVVAGGYMRARGVAGGVLAITGWEDEPAAVSERRRVAAAVLSRHGGATLGKGTGRAWAKGRFHAPYLRDDLIGRGVMVETLETATTWSGLERLYRAVSAALRAHAPFVACHISHVYTTGASLYFTFVATQETGRSDRTVATGQERRVRGDRGGGGDDHPPPRGRSRPRRLSVGREEPSGPRRAARRQGAPRSLGHHEPREAARRQLFLSLTEPLR